MTIEAYMRRPRPKVDPAELLATVHRLGRRSYRMGYTSCGAMTHKVYTTPHLRQAWLEGWTEGSLHVDDRAEREAGFAERTQGDRHAC